MQKFSTCNTVWYIHVQRNIQAQRLKTIKQLHEQYKKGMDELEKCHRKQQVDMQTEIKKEMALLQKKMLMESVSKEGGRGRGRERERERERGEGVFKPLQHLFQQHQEISNVRRTLKNMLAQV